MAGIPEDYLKQKVEDAYELMLRKHFVRRGVEGGLRGAFEAAVDLPALVEHLDRALTNDIEMMLRGKFVAALSEAEQAWEPPRVRSSVAFLAAGASGEWVGVGDEPVDLGGYIEACPLSEVKEMAGDWDRFAEPVAEDLVSGGYVEAPAGWKVAVCRRPEGLDEYLDQMKPAYE